MKVKEIKATEGYYFTQVGEVGEERVFLTAIKGANIDFLQWREATAYEKEEFEKTRKELLIENEHEENIL